MNFLKLIAIIVTLAMVGCATSHPGSRLDNINKRFFENIEKSDMTYRYENNGFNSIVGLEIEAAIGTYGYSSHHPVTTDTSYIVTVDYKNRTVGGPVGMTVYLVTGWATILTLGIVPSYLGALHTADVTLYKDGTPIFEKKYKERVHYIVSMSGCFMGPTSPKQPDHVKEIVGEKIGLNFLNDINENIK